MRQLTDADSMSGSLKWWFFEVGEGFKFFRKKWLLVFRLVDNVHSSLRGALAQLVRAPPCHGGGCRFEPGRLRHFAKSRKVVDTCEIIADFVRKLNPFSLLRLGILGWGAQGDD